MEQTLMTNVVGVPMIGAGVKWVDSMWTIMFMEIVPNGVGKFSVIWYSTTYQGKPTLDSIDLLFKISKRDIDNHTKYVCDTFEQAKEKMKSDNNYHVFRRQQGFQILFYPFDVQDAEEKVKNFASRYANDQ